MLESIVFIIIGVVAGTFTGLIPGIHINLISLLFLSSPLAILLSPIHAIIFIISMAITHTFLDFIPSIYFGAPDEDSALGVLPGHEFLLKGKGHHALQLTIIGSFLAIILIPFLLPFFLMLLPKIYPLLEKFIAFILIWTGIFLVSSNENKMNSILIFLLAGFLGLSTINLPVNQPLLPLLSGLFGSSTILFSLSQKTIPPLQKTNNLNFHLKELIPPAVLTFFVSPICSLLPGMGSSQAAIISSEILPKKKKLNSSQFLILLGSINTLVIASSFFIVLAIEKTRTGAAAAIYEILKNPPILTILSTIIISAIIAIPLTNLISKKIATNLHRINYLRISKFILFILAGIILLVSGFLGILIFIAATTLGLFCIKMGARRSLLMATLLVPTIIFYFPS